MLLEWLQSWLQSLIEYIGIILFPAVGVGVYLCLKRLAKSRGHRTPLLPSLGIILYVIGFSFGPDFYKPRTHILQYIFNNDYDLISIFMSYCSGLWLTT